MSIINRWLKKTTLETYIRVHIEASFIDLLIKLGYREAKPWSDDENERLFKLMKMAKDCSDHIIDKINEQ